MVSKKNEEINQGISGFFERWNSIIDIDPKHDMKYYQETIKNIGQLHILFEEYMSVLT